MKYFILEFIMSRKYEVLEPISQEEFDYRKFGTTLKAIIKSRGFTQMQFAEYAGIDYSTLIAVLAGKRRVYLHSYYKLINALNVTDIVLLSQTIPNEELRQSAETFIKLLPMFSSLAANGNEDTQTNESQH
jgi:transcriptional regulator with XRE-family HTH domain